MDFPEYAISEEVVQELITDIGSWMRNPSLPNWVLGEVTLPLEEVKNRAIQEDSIEKNRKDSNPCS